eukprot:3314125-Prymnesium_polylepis.1
MLTLVCALPALDDVDRATREAYLRFRSRSEKRVGSGGGGLPLVQAGVSPTGLVDEPVARLAIWSGPESAVAYQSRLQLFQNDASAPAARYDDGRIASVDVTGANGVGGALQAIVTESVYAMRAGCRCAAPHVGSAAPWLYAGSAARSGLCDAAEGWDC